MNDVVGELRAEIAELRDRLKQHKRSLGGSQAANNRLKQRVRELEAENDELRRLLADNNDGGGQ